MKTVVFLGALVALAAASAVPAVEVEVEHVDDEFIAKQTKVLLLLEGIGQVRSDTDWWKIGLEYDVEANIDNYTNKEAVEEFLLMYRSGFMPQHATFSVFYDRMRWEAIVLFKLFYYAKDFDTFYKTAAYARVHFNDGLFLYAYYVAMYQRSDTNQLILPAPYEMYPHYFTNTEAFYKAFRIKMQNGIVNPEYARQFGMVQEEDYYVFYSNYSSPWFTGSEEQKLAYFTEDIGVNSYYYWLNIIYPFWFNEGVFKDIKDFRGDLLYFNYQQLLAQYYMERLTNGLGEIPDFSWDKPIKTGYTCQQSTYYPFFQRNDYYEINKVENEDDLQFIKTFERAFLYYIERGHFKAYNQEVDLRNSKSMNFVGNYWFSNADLYEKAGYENYNRFYELTALHLLAGTPEPVDKYTVYPSALELYQTSMRDPVFYQFYKRVLNYIIQYKENLGPYSYSQLHFEGVKVSDVKVDKLVTFFEFFDFEVSNDIFYSHEEYQSDKQKGYLVRQPRLNHKPFTVTVDVKSDVSTDAIVKFFLGPKYDSYGYPLSIEDNWMNFVELDWFVHKLTPGQNKFERKSSEFTFYREDSIPVSAVLEELVKKQVPIDMSQNFYLRPDRMMLPKGTKGGFPFQLYVVVYPYTPLPKELEQYSKYLPDTKPMSYPFDRPVFETYFNQPNIYYEDVFIYHEGEEDPNVFNFKGYYYKNQVPKQ